MSDKDKNTEKLIIKQNDLDELRKSFENEKDLVNREE